MKFKILTVVLILASIFFINSILAAVAFEGNDDNSLLTGSGTRALADSPWPCFGGNVQRTGVSAFSTTSNPGNLRWTFNLGTAQPGVSSSPIIGPGGIIYIGSAGITTGQMYAVGSEGAEIWQFAINKPIYSPPTMGQDGTVYFGSNEAKLYALNSDGTMKWYFRTVDEVRTSPIVDSQGTVYFGSGGFSDSKANYLYALSSGGTEQWKLKTEGGIYSSPAIGSDGTIYFGCTDDNLYAVNPNGTLKWKISVPDSGYSTPAVGSDGTIFVGSGTSSDGALYAVNTNGTEKWVFETSGEVYGSPAIGSDGSVFFGSRDSYLYAVDTGGNQKWKFQTGDSILSSPVISSNGIIYFGSNDDNLYGVNMLGEERMKVKVSDNVVSSPAIDTDGTIYVISSDNVLHAIGKGPTSAPRNLRAVERSSIVDLSWDEPEHTGGAAVSEYNIYRSAGYGDKVKIGTSDQKTTSYRDSDIDLGQLYYYYVTAMNVAGESDYSNKAMAFSSGGTPSVNLKDEEEDVFTETGGEAPSNPDIDITDIKLWKGTNYIMFEINLVGTVQTEISRGNGYVYSINCFVDPGDDITKLEEADYFITYTLGNAVFEDIDFQRERTLDSSGGGTSTLRLPVPPSYLDNKTDFEFMVMATCLVGVGSDKPDHTGFDEGYMDWSLDSKEGKDIEQGDGESDDEFSLMGMDQQTLLMVIAVIVVVVLIVGLVIFMKRRKERKLLLAFHTTPPETLQTYPDAKTPEAPAAVPAGKEAAPAAAPQPPTGVGKAPPATVVDVPAMQLTCPECGNAMKYQEIMQQSYCPNCKKFF
jgi:outer membrane protein assembly factor BamB